MQANLDETCRTIYAETKDFYEAIASACGGLGFKILYGPPFLEPPVLFIGYQPGGGPADSAREMEDGAHERWPSECEYATKNWPLARWLQRMFGQELLEQCVGLNAIFIRAPDAKTYRKDVESNTREKIKRFCLSRTERLIDAIRPQRVVPVGFETLNLFGAGVPDLRNERGRTLTKIGQISGRQAIATLHLSGARISIVDRASIRDRILGI